MGVAERIESKLRKELAPLRLEVVDESDKHAGHAGWREGGETHFRVTIVTEAFAGRSRVTRQRMIYEILADELAGRVHALQLATRTPDEEIAYTQAGKC